jgi:hypothetical protein
MSGLITKFKAQDPISQQLIGLCAGYLVVSYSYSVKCQFSNSKKAAAEAAAPVAVAAAASPAAAANASSGDVLAALNDIQSRLASIEAALGTK